MNEYCNDCRELENTSERGNFSLHAPVKPCPKHAMVDECIAALKAVMKTMPPVEDVGWDDLAAAHAWLETLIEVEEALAKAEPKERGE